MSVWKSKHLLFLLVVVEGLGEGAVCQCIFFLLLCLLSGYKTPITGNICSKKWALRSKCDLDLWGQNWRTHHPMVFYCLLWKYDWNLVFAHTVMTVIWSEYYTDKQTDRTWLLAASFLGHTARKQQVDTNTCLFLILGPISNSLTITKARLNPFFSLRSKQGVPTIMFNTNIWSCYSQTNIWFSFELYSCFPQISTHLPNNISLQHHTHNCLHIDILVTYVNVRELTAIYIRGINQSQEILR